MALYPTKPLFSPSATATNGSDIIQVTGNVNCSFLMAGAIVSIAGANRLADAISGTGVVSGNSTIKLARPWAGATVTGQMIVFMSYEGLADAVFQLKSIIDQAAASADIGMGYLGNYDLAAAGALPPAPADGTGSRMYRISTAAAVASVAYRAGEVIYFDQYLNVWRRMNEALGSGAYANVVASVGDLTAGRLLTVGATKAQLADDVYGRSNILGTVSQSAGVPTGAIIQRGANANGDFTRFADGTQFCRLAYSATSDVTTPDGQLFRGPVEAWSFPISFAVDAPALSGQLPVVGAWVSQRGNHSFTICNFVWQAAQASTADGSAVLSAYGRWY
jgi:hypothetical protein